MPRGEEEETVARDELLFFFIAPPAARALVAFPTQYPSSFKKMSADNLAPVVGGRYPDRRASRDDAEPLQQRLPDKTCVAQGIMTDAPVVKSLGPQAELKR